MAAGLAKRGGDDDYWTALWSNGGGFIWIPTLFLFGFLVLIVTIGSFCKRKPKGAHGRAKVANKPFAAIKTQPWARPTMIARSSTGLRLTVASSSRVSAQNVEEEQPPAYELTKVQPAVIKARHNDFANMV